MQIMIARLPYFPYSQHFHFKHIRICHISGSSSKSQHGIFLFRLKPGAAFQVTVFVRLEVCCPVNDRPRVKMLHKGKQVFRQMIDKNVLFFSFDEFLWMNSNFCNHKFRS